MNKKKRKKIIKNRIISDISMISKSIIIFVLVLIPIVFLMVQGVFIVSSAERSKKAEIERIEVDVTKEYFNIIVENIVSIAKTIYSNEKVYEFINQTYSTNMEYFDAYYQFNESKTLTVAETSIIKDYKIYTANSTIIKGGNINIIDQNVKKEKWYDEFHNLNKDMIIYCDQESGTLSLIRKLNFVGVKTGEALLKMDINTGNIQKSFEGTEFDGKVYVSSGNILLYSNNKKAKYSDIYNLSSNNVTKTKVNFYTATLDFYASATENSTLDTLTSDPVNMVVVIIVIVNCLLVLRIIFDIRGRIVRLSATCNKKTANILTEDFGDDEIGTLHKNLLDLLTQLSIYKTQNERLNNYIDRYIDRSEDMEVQAYDLDAGLYYMERFGRDAGRSIVDTSSLMTFEREAISIRRYIEYINSNREQKIDFEIKTDKSFTNDAYILPLSLVLIAIDIIETASKENQKCNFEMNIKQEEEKVFVYYKADAAKFSSVKLLRIRATFEPDDSEKIPEFETGYYCNSFIRLKKYYDRNIDINIISDSEIEFELIFDKEILFKNYRGKQSEQD